MNSPSTMASPPTTSSIPPIPICDHHSIRGMSGTGFLGQPNSFMVPAVKNMKPAITRNTPSMRPLHGGGGESVIGIGTSGLGG